MPEMHLKQPIFITYSASQSFTKYEERIQKSEKQEIIDTFIDIIYTKHASNLIWLIKN